MLAQRVNDPLGKKFKMSNFLSGKALTTFYIYKDKTYFRVNSKDQEIFLMKIFVKSV